MNIYSIPPKIKRRTISKKISRRYWVMLWFLALSRGAAGQSFPQFTVEPVPEYDAHFERDEGWTGADGAYTVPLNENTILWLFSDTWVGEIREGKHLNATMINNSAALQYGKDPAGATVEFFYRTRPDGKPSALIEPLDSQGWFWLNHGVANSRGLYLFLMQIERTDESVFGFRHVAAWLGHVENPRDRPIHWRISQHKIPWDQPSRNGNRTFGSAVLKEEDEIYVYGYDEEKREDWLERYMVLARVNEGQIEDFNAWRFYRDDCWLMDYRQAGRLCSQIATEYSVSYQPALQKYVVLYTENGLSRNIQIRVADNPWGPWSAPITIYRCPEVEWHPTYFCYAAKGHPFLSVGPNELLFSYVTNSTDFWQMASDARIYRPRFLRIEFLAREDQNHLPYVTIPESSLLEGFLIQHLWHESETAPYNVLASIRLHGFPTVRVSTVF